MSAQPCSLCAEEGGRVVFRDELLRVVLVDDPDLPGFVRVIANAHAKEMTDLDVAARAHMMGMVFRAEQAVRTVFAPHKMNVASLGNMVPHVHWHVIPRFTDDAFFPQPIWGARQRATPSEVVAARAALIPGLAQALAEACTGGAP
jgi:diadenosine tetraphosphate (Ap4A) HIT family hydrolase